jgi:type II secretory pathway pseudopilin PulG
MFPTPNSRSQIADRRSQGQRVLSRLPLLRTANCELRTRQEGFTLAALIVILTIMSIIVAFTVPEQWSMVLKRERDRQTIFLMKQYARGILAWQLKHNSPPLSLEQLQEARSPRLLRGTGKWPCPITGKEGDWILVPATAILAPGVPPIPSPNEDIIGGNSARDPSAGPQTTGRLNAQLSPEDYTGPFVAVRPKAKGKSFIAFNGAETYEEWVYTVMDLTNEIAARNMPMPQ